MPVTPYHFGPGLLIKALAPRHVSFTAFVVANVVIDLESVVNLIAGRSPVHATLHTLVGALIVGTLSGWATAVIAKRLGSTRPSLAMQPALVGGVLGGLGQTVLDAIMHRDLLPLLPFSAANPILRVVDLGVLHAACMVTGLVGTVVLLVRKLAKPPSRTP